MSAMNFATKSQSIKTKLIKFFVGLILLVVVIESVFNLFLLKPLVVYSKTQIIQNAFTELKSDYSSDLKEVETIAEKLQNKHGIKVVLFSGDKIIYSTGFSSKENFKPRKNQNAPDDKPNDSFFGIDSSKVSTTPKVITKTEHDKTQRLELTGKFKSNGKYVYVVMMLPIESIDSSVSLFTKVNIAVSVFVLILGIIIAVYLSRSITKPIISVENVTKNLSNLDFSAAADEHTGSVELYSLAQSINSMSDTLRRNIDELQQANSKLKSDIEYKNQAEEMRRRFVANASHEMKTPLALLRIYSESLKDNIEGVDKDYYCSVIAEETENLSDMVSSMLDISSIESGIGNMNFAPVDVSEMCREVTEKFRNGYRDLDIRLNAEDGIFVTGDKKHLAQTVNNYVQNAISHTADDKPITISLTKDEDCAKLSVENFGKKIEERDMEHLWDAFYKSDKARTRNGKNNVGLGLYIVRTIIEKHGGTYGVHNTEKGVAFWWKIPLCD